MNRNQSYLTFVGFVSVLQLVLVAFVHADMRQQSVQRSKTAALPQKKLAQATTALPSPPKIIASTDEAEIERGESPVPGLDFERNSIPILLRDYGSYLQPFVRIPWAYRTKNWNLLWEMLDL